MSSDPDFVEFTDEFGARRRRAEQRTPGLLQALGQVAREAQAAAPATLPGADGAADVAGCNRPMTALATVHATSDLLADTLAELSRAEEELRAQNEALFAARIELEEEQQAFRDLFDLAPTAALVTNEGGGILRINQAALALLGRPINAVIGKPITAYVALDDRLAFRAALHRAVRSLRVETWPVRLVPKHGDPIECRVRTRVVHTRVAYPLPGGLVQSAPTPGPPVSRSAAPALHWVVTEELWHSTDDLA